MLHAALLGGMQLILTPCLQGFLTRRFNAAATAQKLIEMSPDFWSSQLVVLQMPGSAAILDQGRVTHRFSGQVPPNLCFVIAILIDSIIAMC